MSLIDEDCLRQGFNPGDGQELTFATWNVAEQAQRTPEGRLRIAGEIMRLVQEGAAVVGLQEVITQTSNGPSVVDSLGAMGMHVVTSEPVEVTADKTALSLAIVTSATNKPLETVDIPLQDRPFGGRRTRHLPRLLLARFAFDDGEQYDFGTYHTYHKNFRGIPERIRQFRNMGQTLKQLRPAVVAGDANTHAFQPMLRRAHRGRSLVTGGGYGNKTWGWPTEFPVVQANLDLFSVSDQFQPLGPAAVQPRVMSDHRGLLGRFRRNLPR